MTPVARSSGLLTAARTLAVDAWTAEAVDALRQSSVDAILLKGPVTMSWLYGAGETRDYVDADLLVRPSAVTEAERALTTLGYTLRDPAGELVLISGPHAQTWWRPLDGATIDLHHTFPGEVLAEDLVWSTVWPRAVPMAVGGARVPVLDEASRALLVALHAAHHGPGARTPMEDLRRAVSRVPDAVWREAASIAEDVMALPQFARGLRLLPAGEDLAARLRLPSPDLMEALEDDGVASGFERLAAAGGVRARCSLVWREAFPPRSFMHWWLPWSRASRPRLVFAYGYRVAWLATHAAPGYRAWRRRRASA